VFSFAEKSDLKPDEMAGLKTSMKSMRLRKAHFSYVLVFIKIKADFVGKRRQHSCDCLKQRSCVCWITSTVGCWR
jgi:hypothetical protein